MNQVSAIKTAHKDSGYLVPKCASLDSFTAIAATGKGVRLSDLPPLTNILLRTSNSEYLITVIDPGSARVSISGGRFPGGPTEAVVWGASLGGAFLQTGLIGIGLQLEMAYQTADGMSRKLVTSPVDHLFIERVSEDLLWDIESV